MAVAEAEVAIVVAAKKRNQRVKSSLKKTKSAVNVFNQNQGIFTSARCAKR